MNSRQTNPDPIHQQDVELLLDAQLGRLDSREIERLEQRLSDEKTIEACDQRLTTCLKPLGAWTTDGPAPGLADRVIRSLTAVSIATAGSERAWSGLPAEEGRITRRPFLSFAEMLAMAACIAVFVGFAIPGVSGARFHARQTLCANNLRIIFSGASGYAQVFGGQLPNAGTMPGAYWLRNASASSPAASNSRHTYMLVTLRFVAKPEAFICAGRSGDASMDAAAIDRFDDFPSATNNSYDALNMNGPFGRLDCGIRLPIQSDANPLFDGPDLNPESASLLNSRSHGSRGQNVLFSDGSVPFVTTPRVGPGEDNIWQAGDLIRYKGNEIPTCEADAFLVPGARRDPNPSGK